MGFSVNSKEICLCNVNSQPSPREENILPREGCQVHMVFLKPSYSTSKIFPYSDAAAFLWKVAQCNLGIVLGKEENRPRHRQKKMSDASYSRLLVFSPTCPQCVEILSIFILTQPHTTVLCSSLLKRCTLQLLAPISQSWHLCSCTDRPHKTTLLLTLCDS